jgi:hypothetical protein
MPCDTFFSNGFRTGSGLREKVETIFSHEAALRPRPLRPNHQILLTFLQLDADIVNCHEGPTIDRVVFPLSIEQFACEPIK